MAIQQSVTLTVKADDSAVEALRATVGALSRALVQVEKDTQGIEGIDAFKMMARGSEIATGQLKLQTKALEEEISVIRSGKTATEEAFRAKHTLAGAEAADIEKVIGLLREKTALERQKSTAESATAGLEQQIARLTTLARIKRENLDLDVEESRLKLTSAGFSPADVEQRIAPLRAAKRALRELTEEQERNEASLREQAQAAAQTGAQMRGLFEASQRADAAMRQETETINRRVAAGRNQVALERQLIAERARAAGVTEATIQANLRARAAQEDYNRSLNRGTLNVGGFISSSLALFGIYQGADIFRQAAVNIYTTARAYQNLEAQLRTINPSQTAVAESFSYVRAEANRLGLTQRDLAIGFTRLSLAAKDTSITGGTIRKVFEGISSAGAVLGFTADQSERAMRSLEQMVSKGTLSMEELRGQLGDVLPGAMGIFTNAAVKAGIATDQVSFAKLIAQGKVLVDERLLTRVADELSRGFGAEASANANRLAGSMSLLKNATDDLLLALNKSGIEGLFVTALKTLTAEVQYFSGLLDGVKFDPAMLVAGLDAVKTALLGAAAAYATFTLFSPAGFGAAVTFAVGALARLTSAMVATTAAMAVNPIGWIIGGAVLVAGVTKAVYDYRDAQKAADEATLKDGAAAERYKILTERLRDARVELEQMERRPSIFKLILGDDSAQKRKEIDGLVTRLANVNAELLKTSFFADKGIFDFLTPKNIPRYEIPGSAQGTPGVAPMLSAEQVAQRTASEKVAAALREQTEALKLQINPLTEVAKAKAFLKTLDEAGVKANQALSAELLRTAAAADKLKDSKKSLAEGGGQFLASFGTRVNEQQADEFSFDTPNTAQRIAAIEAVRDAMKTELAARKDILETEKEQIRLALDRKAAEMSSRVELQQLLDLKRAYVEEQENEYIASVKNRQAELIGEGATEAGAKVAALSEVTNALYVQAAATSDLTKQQGLLAAAAALGQAADAAATAARVDNAKRQIEVAAQIKAELASLAGGSVASSAVAGLSTEQIESYDKFSEMLDAIGDSARGMGDGFTETFERIAKGVKGLKVAANAFENVGKNTKDNKSDLEDYADATALALGGIQSMTEEGSKAYKALGVAQAAVTAISAVLAVVQQGTSGDPYTAFGRMAAMAVAIAALGVQIKGFSGNDSATAAPSGPSNSSGTVFGDPAAQSQSIANAIEQLVALQDSGLEVSAKMLTALRSIESAVRNVGLIFARRQAAGGDDLGINRPDFATSNFQADEQRALEQQTRLANFLTGNYLIGSLTGLDVDELFNGLGADMAENVLGGITSVTLGSGLMIRAGQTLGDVFLNGVSAAFFARIRISEDAEFGRTVSDTYLTILRDADSETTRILTNVIRGIGDTILDAAGLLGVDMDLARQQLMALEVGIGKINLKGLSASEIQERLSAVFSTFADNISEEMFPALTEFQQIGEGLFETLVRVAAQTSGVREIFDRLNVSFNLTYLEAARASQNLIDLAGGVEEFGQNVSNYYEGFFSEEERLEDSGRALTKQLQQLGLTLPETRDGFRALVSGLDLTTKSGQALFVSLTSLSGAADEYYSGIEDAIEAALALARKASDLIFSIRDSIDAINGDPTGIYDLQRTLSDLLQADSRDEQLDAAETLRSTIVDRYNYELAAVNRTRDERVKALTTERDTIVRNAQAQIDAAKRIREYLEGLDRSDIAPTTPQQQLETALAQFRGYIAQALTGDTSAAASAQTVGADVINLAREIFASSSAYTSIFDEIKASLGTVVTEFADAVPDEGTLESIDAAIKLANDTAAAKADELRLAAVAGLESLAAYIQIGNTKLDELISAVFSLEAPSPLPAGVSGAVTPAKFISASPPPSTGSGAATSTGSGAGDRALADVLEALRADLQAADGNVQISIVTPDGKTIQQLTLAEIKRRSRAGEKVIYAAGVES